MGYLKKHSKKQRKMKPKVGSKKTKRRYNKSTTKRRYNKSTIKRKNNKLSLKRRKYYKQRGGGIIKEHLNRLDQLSGSLTSRLNHLKEDERLNQIFERLILIKNEVTDYRYKYLPKARGDDEQTKKLIPRIEERIAELDSELNDIKLEIEAEEARAVEEDEESTKSYHGE